MQNSKRFCFILIALWLAPASAAEVYKWVDENGRVHFSQRPPAAANQSVEAMDVKSRSGIKPVEISGTLMCGSMRLPGPDDDPVIQLANIQGNLPAWKKYLDDTNRQLGRLMATGRASAQSLVRERERIDEYKCAIAWGEEQLRDLKGTREELVTQTERVRAEYEAILAECGEEPTETGWTTDPAAKEWVNCQRRTRNQRNAKYKELKRYESKLRLLE